jgi:glutathione S-transferase
MTFVDLDVALAGPGLRLVILADVPSPWSQAALAILRYKKLSFMCARARAVDSQFQMWRGSRNLPALLMDGQPIRTGWAEILAFAESLEREPALVPSDPDERIRVIGLCHELMSEGGLLWCARVLAIDAGLSSAGREGFSLPAAQYLAPRYGWTPSSAPGATAHAREVLAFLETELAHKDGPFYSGNSITALDLYSAAAMNALVPLPDTHCHMAASFRAAFTWMGRALGDGITPALLAHRDRVISEFLEVPIEL